MFCRRTSHQPRTGVFLGGFAHPLERFAGGAQPKNNHFDSREQCGLACWGLEGCSSHTSRHQFGAGYLIPADPRPQKRASTPPRLPTERSSTVRIAAGIFDALYASWVSSQGSCSGRLMCFRAGGAYKMGGGHESFVILRTLKQSLYIPTFTVLDMPVWRVAHNEPASRL